jgi:predicted RNase H-like HicB family nuclease
LTGPKLVNLHLDIDREADGRWIAEFTDLPGAMTYGRTRDEALATAKALALRVLADRLDSGELHADELTGVHFAADVD